MENITPEMARAELARRELDKRKNPPNPQQQGISSIPSDIGNSAANLLMSAGEKAMMLPEEIGEAGGEFAKNPLYASHRASKGVLSGLAEAGKQAYNLPLNLNTYLASKNIPGFKQLAPLAEKLKVGNTGIEEKFMGKPQKGDVFWKDVGSLAPAFLAPESIRPPITARGITNRMSSHKAERLNQARQDYSELFNEAGNQGLTHALPGEQATNNRQLITRNSRPTHHRSYVEYLNNPTLENAHWAQSELGALTRHLDKIANKNGLTPIQHQTLRAAEEARNNIRESMFSNNAIGANPQLAERYNQLSNQYRENVIPYTRLEELSEVEQNRMLPKTAIEKLSKDDQFMIELSRRYPGLLLHRPLAKKVGLAGAGLLGYDELKKLLKNF